MESAKTKRVLRLVKSFCAGPAYFLPGGVYSELGKTFSELVTQGTIQVFGDYTATIKK